MREEIGSLAREWLTAGLQPSEGPRPSGVSFVAESSRDNPIITLKSATQSNKSGTEFARNTSGE